MEKSKPVYHAIFWRGNPQLANGGYYTLSENKTLKELKSIENPIYGSMSLIERYSAKQLEQAKADLAAYKAGEK